MPRSSSIAAIWVPWNAFHFDRMGKFVVSAGDDHTLRVWNASGEQGPRFIPGTTNANSSIALNPDGRSVACLQVDGDLGLQAGQLRLVLIDAQPSAEPTPPDSYTFKARESLRRFGL